MIEGADEGNSASVVDETDAAAGTDTTAGADEADPTAGRHGADAAQRIEAPRSDDREPPTDTDATLLGLDYGTRRIGVAVGERRLGRARPLGTVANVDGTPDWRALDARVDEWRPAAFVVGWPLDETGAETALVPHVRGFARRLARRYDRPVHAVDERYSSIAANERLAAERASGRRRRRVSHADVDATAAALILEHWLAGESVA